MNCIGLTRQGRVKVKGRVRMGRVRVRFKEGDRSNRGL
jgi:hypothetical protein